MTNEEMIAEVFKATSNVNQRIRSINIYYEQPAFFVEAVPKIDIQFYNGPQDE